MNTISIHWSDVIFNYKDRFMLSEDTNKSRLFINRRRTPVVRFYFFSDDKDFYLTFRQMQVLSYLSTLSTTRDISEKTGLSVRTIEDYVSKLRSKFKCFRTKEIIIRINNDSGLRKQLAKNIIILKKSKKGV